jgi:hypothetical protein
VVYQRSECFPRMRNMLLSGKAGAAIDAGAGMAIRRGLIVVWSSARKHRTLCRGHEMPRFISRGPAAPAGFTQQEIRWSFYSNNNLSLLFKKQ